MLLGKVLISFQWFWVRILLCLPYMSNLSGLSYADTWTHKSSNFLRHPCSDSRRVSAPLIYCRFYSAPKS